MISPPRFWRGIPVSSLDLNIVRPYLFIHYSFYFGCEFDGEALLRGVDNIKGVAVNYYEYDYDINILLTANTNTALNKIYEYDDAALAPSYKRRLRRVELKKIKVKNTSSTNFKVGDIEVIISVFDVGMGVITFCCPIETDDKGLSVDELIKIQNDIVTGEENFTFTCLLDRKICETYVRIAPYSGAHLMTKGSLIEKLRSTSDETIQVEDVTFYLLFFMIHGFVMECFRDRKYASFNEMLIDKKDTIVSIDIQLIVNNSIPTIESFTRFLSTEEGRKIVYGLITRDPKWRYVIPERAGELVSDNLGLNSNFSHFIGFDSSIIFYRNGENPTRFKDLLSLPEEIIQGICMYSFAKFIRDLLDHLRYVLDTQIKAQLTPRYIAEIRDYIRRHVIHHYHYAFLDSSSYLQPFRNILDNARRIMKIEDTYNNITDKLEHLDRMISIIYNEATEYSLMILNIVVSGSIALAIAKDLLAPLMGIQQPTTTNILIIMGLSIMLWSLICFSLFRLIMFFKRKIIKESMTKPV